MKTGAILSEEAYADPPWEDEFGPNDRQAEMPKAVGGEHGGKSKIDGSRSQPSNPTPTLEALGVSQSTVRDDLSSFHSENEQKALTLDRNELAVAFIRHALTFPVRVVAMLLTVDFDSGKTRADLFRDNPRFALKIVLLDRIVWFEPARASPSTNHAWFVWHGLQRYAQLRYAEKAL